MKNCGIYSAFKFMNVSYKFTWLLASLQQSVINVALFVQQKRVIATY